MKLTEEQILELQPHFESVTHNLKCPICGERNSYEPNFNAIIWLHQDLKDGGVTLGAGPATIVVPLSCQKCARMEFINVGSLIPFK